MGRLQSIETALSSINQVVFQELCDSFLALKNNNYSALSRTISNHPILQAENFSQGLGSDIYLCFQRSILLWKVFFACLPEVHVDLFQGKVFQLIEPEELYQHGMVCRIVLEVVLFELKKFVHLLKVHKHLFDKAVIDRIILREMMAIVHNSPANPTVPDTWILAPPMV